MRTKLRQLGTAAGFLLLLAYGLRDIVAEDNSDPGPNPPILLANQASKRNIGSASICRGKVLIAEIFVDDLDSGWSSDEIQEVGRRMDAAAQFVIMQGKGFNEEISVARIEPARIRWEQAVPLDSTAHPGWTEKLIRRASGLSAVAWTQQLKEEKKVDSVLICLHVDKAALSYNLAYYTSIAEEFMAERMICFTRYPDGRATADATYAHEILHLFGAGDLYFPYDATADRMREAQVQFPNDVMLRVDYDLSQLNVGEFTAYRVGWLNSLAEKLRRFED